jgi:hypothetical protein
MILNKSDKPNVFTGAASEKLIDLSILPPVKLFQPKGNDATLEFLETCPVNSTWIATSPKLGASAVLTIAPSHPNWATVEQRALTLFTPLDFSPLPPEQAISYLGTPDSLNTWSRPVSLNSSSGESTSSIENFFGSTSGGMLVTAGESIFYLDPNAAKNPENLATLFKIIENEEKVVFYALESHSTSLESRDSTSMVLKESSPIAMKLLDLTPQMFLIETNSSPLSVLVEGSFPNPLMIEASRQLLNNSLIEPNYSSSNTTEVLPSPSDSKKPTSLDVVVRKTNTQARAPLAANTTAPNFTSFPPDEQGTPSQFPLLSELFEKTTARSNSNNVTDIIFPLLTMWISGTLGNLTRISIGTVSDKTSDLPAAGGASASLKDNVVDTKLTSSEDDSSEYDSSEDDSSEYDSSEYDSSEDDSSEYDSDNDAEVASPADATGGDIPVERRDPIIENRQAIEDAMRAAIASTTQINWGLGIKSKQQKNSELRTILDKFTKAKNSEELKVRLIEFIENAEQHRVGPIFFDSPTKSMQAFNAKLNSNELKVVKDIIDHKRDGRKPS